MYYITSLKNAAYFLSLNSQPKSIKAKNGYHKIVFQISPRIF